MSAVAIQFDPSFGMGHRNMFTWAGSVDSSASSSSMLSNSDFSSMTSGSEPSMTPPGGPKSMLPSPTRLSLTTEQHDLRRQQDRSRRDSKLSSRMRRGSVTSYSSTSPIAMTDVSGAMNLPIYTTAPASVSLLSEPSSLSPQSYMAPYSPPMHDHGAQVFGTSYPHVMQPSYSMSMDYPTYSAPSDYSTRASSLPDGGMMYQVPPTMTSGGTGAQEASHVRVVQSRPKPRCWEHGCNGRQFSTFSNLLRHQREKSGQATKATCPNCGAEFTRTTARNGHLLHDKCKQRRSS